MRKFAAILIMSILVFNLCGYRLVIAIMENKADNRLKAQLDQNEFDESQLIEIKIALNSPNQENFTEDERYYGQIEMRGITYTYVKSKIEGDILVLKCIPNESFEQLEALHNDLAKANSDAGAHQPAGKHQKSFAKSFFSEYGDQLFFNSVKPEIPASTSLSSFCSFVIPKIDFNPPLQPPEC